MPAGRPPVYATEEERLAAKAAAKARSKEKTKNITLDADLFELLNSKASSLEADFGFRPTLSQTVRYLIAKGGA